MPLLLVLTLSLIVLLLSPMVALAQTSDDAVPSVGAPTVQGPIIQATSVPDTSSEAQDITFNLPDTSSAFGWREGVIVALLVLIGAQFYIANGSVPLPVVNGLLGFARQFTRATPGTTDDRLFEYVESFAKPALDPNRWPALIQDLVTEGVISGMEADEVISSIAAQKLTPYKAFEQASAMAHYYRARAATAIKERSGASTVNAQSFPSSAGAG
jgi:hypothetical protein